MRWARRAGPCRWRRSRGWPRRWGLRLRWRRRSGGRSARSLSAPAPFGGKWGRRRERAAGSKVYAMEHMGQPTESAELQTCKLAYAHVKMLWDDQVALAHSLVEKRKTRSTMLAVVVGLGVYRLQFTHRSDETLSIDGDGLK